MRKANDKSTDQDTAAEASTAPAGETSTDPAATVLHATPSNNGNPPQQGDQQHGRGGLFTVVNGQRILTERTEQPSSKPTH